MPQPVDGAPITQEAEDQVTVLMQTAATANGNGTVANLTGYAGTATLELANTGTGSCTVTLQGSYDGINWYNVGYAQLDNQSSPARTVGGIGVTASSAHVYSVQDTYWYYQAVISATAGSLALTATIRGLPV